MRSLALLVLALPVLAQERELPDVLGRVPTELPRAKPGRWAEWDPTATPDPPGAYVVALDRYRGGDLVGALTELWSVLEVEPEYPPALHMMGGLYFRLRRYGDSVFAYERFLSHAPGLIGQTRRLGHGYYSLGRYESAARHYELVLETEPDMVEALRGYALAKMRLGEPGAALENLRRVLALEPRHAEAQYWLARVLFDEEETETALAEAERARDLDPFDPRPWFLLAQIRLELGDEPAAAAARTRFLEVDRVAQETRHLEAQLLFDPTRADLLVEIVEHRARIGDAPRVRGALRRLVDLDPKRLEYRTLALRTLFDLGDGDGAAWAARSLVENCADEKETWRHLHHYYGRIRDRRRQVSAAERFLELGGTPEDLERIDDR